MAWAWVDNSWLQYKPHGLYKGAAYTMKIKSYSCDFTEVRLIFCAAYNPEITVDAKCKIAMWNKQCEEQGHKTLITLRTWGKKAENVWKWDFFFFACHLWKQLKFVLGLPVWKFSGKNIQEKGHQFRFLPQVPETLATPLLAYLFSLDNCNKKANTQTFVRDTVIKLCKWIRVGIHVRLRIIGPLLFLCTYKLCLPLPANLIEHVFTME